MGFVTNSDKITLNAFYTQKGRAFYLNGTDSDKKIKYFALGDSDTNYRTSSTPVENEIYNNTLESGFVPDLSGNYDSCLKTVADGVENTFLINYKPSGTTNVLNEVRLFSPSTNNYDGTNVLNIKVDLGAYIKWLKTYSEYSTNQSSFFNSNQTNLSSPFIKFYDYIGTYDLVGKSIDQDHSFEMEFSYGDYKMFEQLNRFLVDSSLPNNFRTVIPSYASQSSPLSIVFSTKLDNTSNGSESGQGQGGLIINNRSYVYLYKVGTGYTTYELMDTAINGINVDYDQSFSLIPGVVISYYQNGEIKKETFKLRDDFGTFKNKNPDVNNQYLKMFVSLDNTKSLATREAELLESFILSRTDLFNHKNGVYYSNPINIFVNSDDESRSGSVKLTLYMNTNIVPSVTPSNTFLI